MSYLKKITKEDSQERGVTLLEYIFLASLIMLVCLAGVQGIGLKVAGLLSSDELKDGMTVEP